MKNPNQVGFNAEDTTASDWDDIGDYFVKDDEIDIDSLHDEKGNLTINHWNEAHADGELREKLHEYWGSDEVKEIQGDLREEQAKADEFTTQLQDIYDSVEAGKGKIEKRLQKSPNDEEIEVEYFINEKGYTQNLNVLKKHQAEHLDWVKHYEDKLTQGENEAAFGVMQNTAIENAENHASQLSAEAKDIYEQLSGLKEGEISSKFQAFKIYDGRSGYKESLDSQTELIKDVFDKLDNAEAEKARAERLRNSEVAETADEEKSTFNKEADKIEAQLYYDMEKKIIDATIDRANRTIGKYQQDGETARDVEDRLRRKFIEVDDTRIGLEREHRNPSFAQKIKNIFPSFRKKFNEQHAIKMYEVEKEVKEYKKALNILWEGQKAQKIMDMPYRERVENAVNKGRKYEGTRTKVQIEANKRLLDMLKERF